VIAFAVLMGFVLWAAYRYLRFGLATRAAAGNEKGAVLLGYSPQTLAAINWVIASVLATLSVIIVGPIAGTITPVGLTALIVPALAAALIGGLRSIPIAVAGGLALGAVQTLLDVKKVTWFGGSFEWMQTGVRNFLPLVVIIVVLYARGKSLPIRGAVEEKRLPIAPDPRRVWEHAFFWIVVLTLMAFVFEDAGGRTRFANSMQTGLVVSIVMLSIVLITGYTGQISLAQMSFAGIAAFVMARMMADGIGRGSNLVPVDGPGLAWPIAGLIGIVAAVVVGVVVGLPAVRIRGVQLAVVTIAAAVALQGLYFENPEITQLRAGVPAFVKDPTIFGINVGARSAREQNENPAFVIFGAIVLALCAIAVANMRRSGVGRRFLAVRANERAAAAAGINVTRTKLLAFAISAAIAGVGGLMLGFKQVEVSSANFAYGASLSVLAFAYLAGISSISGAIVAGMLLQALVPTTSNYFFAGTNIDNYIGLLSGIGIIVTAIVHPEGVAPFFTEGVRHLGNWMVSAIPGAETLRSNYRGPKQVLVKVGLAILVVGTALWLYNAKFIESVEWWVFVSMVLLFLVTLAFARVVGPISPTFPGAGRVWASAARRFGPTALVGYVLGWIIWPLRVDTYSMFWMPILGALIALMVRNVYLQVRGGRSDHASAPPPTDAPKISTTIPTPAEVN
jgi:ABC-type branched-subunit amino acid transport system permease subunit